MEVIVGLDIGGTKFMAAAVNPDRKIIARERTDTPRLLDEGLALLKQMARAVAGENKIKAIGASAGGPLNSVTGVVSPLHFPEWRNVPLKSIMEDEFKVPFYVEVDTDAAALAEYYFGGNDNDRLLYLTLSTGMGGGLIFDGKIYRGHNGSHPEVGHQSIPYRLGNQNKITCPCGANDCLEAIVCGSAIRKIYGKTADQLTAVEWDEVAYNLGQGLRNLAAIYAPGVIVLGGGVAIGGGSRLIDGAMKVLESNVKIVPIPKIQISNLGYDTALWGAIALGFGYNNSF